MRGTVQCMLGVQQAGLAVILKTAEASIDCE